MPLSTRDVTRVLCVLCACCVLCDQTGYNLVVCAYALGDRDGMKDAFMKLLTVKSLEVEEEEQAGLSGLIGQDDDDMKHVSTRVPGAARCGRLWGQGNAGKGIGGPHRWAGRCEARWPTVFLLPTRGGLWKRAARKAQRQLTFRRRGSPAKVT